MEKIEKVFHHDELDFVLKRYRMTYESMSTLNHLCQAAGNKNKGAEIQDNSNNAENSW